MMHIPLITTTGRTHQNPGDTFIGVGLQYLFEKVLGPQTWVLIDRFNPNGFRSREKLVRRAPFLVYGGMPQYNNYDDWKHWYDDAMWRDFIVRWRLKTFTMAGGAGFSHPNVSINEFVEHCMRSRKTERIIRQRVRPSLCFTVRDAYAHALLDTLNISNYHLPCSSTWATKMWQIEPAANRPYLLLVPPSLRHAQKRANGKRLPRSRRYQLFASLWNSYYKTLKESGHDVKTICHGYKEYIALRDAVPADDLLFHGDCYTLLRQYASAHTVVSARLHGSLPAFGLCGTRVLNISVDVRGTAVQIFPKIRNILASEANPDILLSTLAELQPSEPEDLLPWEKKYREVIQSALPNEVR